MRFSQPQNQVEEFTKIKGELWSLKMCRLAPTIRYKNEKLMVIDGHKEDGPHKFIGISGTDDLRDFIRNITIKLGRFMHDAIHGSEGWRVHSGFDRSAEDCLEAMQKEENLDLDTTYHFAGHSKGAATALLLALKMNLMGFKVDCCNLYGAPMVTKDKIEVPFTCNNIVCKGDPVFELPPEVRGFKDWVHLVEPTVIGDDIEVYGGVKKIINHVVDHYIWASDVKLVKAKETDGDIDFSLIKK